MKLFPTMQDLLRWELASREDPITVESIWDKVEGSPIDRSKPRPWKLIPSIQDFKIALQPYDWLLLLFGFKKKIAPKLTFYTWFNDDANKYIDFMFKKLRIQVEKKLYNEAVDTIWILMNSTAYQVAATNYVLHNWHRKMPWKQVQYVLRDLNKLVKHKSVALKYARVYLQETNKLRPLGVPNLSWRIYLHMYNNCLVEWRSVTESGKQHGYLPKRGILTAWTQLVSKLNEPNIYEADFKGFFDNVTHSGIHEVLVYQLHLPESEAIWIRMINQSIPALPTSNPQEDPLTEIERLIPLKADGMPNEQSIWAQDPEGLLSGFGYWSNWPVLAPEFDEVGTLSWMMMTQSMVKDRGVPQGAPTSCSIATLALRFIENKLDVIIYADDVIYFPKDSSQDPAWVLEDSSMGIRVNKEKSRWIKKDGVWLVDSFKFLGIRYYTPKAMKWALEEVWQILVFSFLLDLCLGYPACCVLSLSIYTLTKHKEAQERFCADTRKGAKLEFTKRESFLVWLAIARELMLESKYFKRGTLSLSLSEWIQLNFIKWDKLKRPLRLLFMEPFKNREIEEKISNLNEGIKILSLSGQRSLRKYMQNTLQYHRGLEERFPSFERDLSKGIQSTFESSSSEIKYLQEKIRNLEKKLWVSNKLMGFFVSRMHFNSWFLNAKQNFKLGAHLDSWCALEWGRYSMEWTIPREKLNVFIASSFACHDLMEWLEDYKHRGKILRIRRVSSKVRKPYVHQLVKETISNTNQTSANVLF